MPPKNKIALAVSLCFDKSPEDAIKYLESQGIKITWNWRDALKAIKEYSFTVSKVSNADILQSVLNSLTKALDEGKSMNEFKNELSGLLADKGYAKKEDGSAWRLDTIYRMNLQTAYMAGRYQQMNSVTDLFPYWEFVAIQDSRTTYGCTQLNGVILPANDPFWKTNLPPRHFNCRSRVMTVNAETMARDGKTLSDTKTFRGVRPAEGFDNIPGQWSPDFSKYDPALAKQVKQVVGG